MTGMKIDRDVKATSSRKNYGRGGKNNQSIIIRDGGVTPRRKN